MSNDEVKCVPIIGDFETIFSNFTRNICSFYSAQLHTILQSQFNLHGVDCNVGFTNHIDPDFKQHQQCKITMLLCNSTEWVVLISCAMLLKEKGSLERKKNGASQVCCRAG